MFIKKALIVGVPTLFVLSQPLIQELVYVSPHCLVGIKAAFSIENRCSSELACPRYSLLCILFQSNSTLTATMSNDATPDWGTVSLDPKFTWTNGTSAKGETFKIGTPIEAPGPGADAARQHGAADMQHAAPSGKTPFDITVKWTGGPPPACFDASTKPSAQETATTSITSYQINTGYLYYNELAFACTEAYNFTFYDATGDYYTNNVFLAYSGISHHIIYFSSNPTIVRITGS